MLKAIAISLWLTAVFVTCEVPIEGIHNETTTDDCQVFPQGVPQGPPCEEAQSSPAHHEGRNPAVDDAL